MEDDIPTVCCPACWQPLVLEVDPSVSSQVYIEDCSVCCQPMRVEITLVEGEVQIEVSPGND
jgi:hypothetical protein